jgi:hypothetical protein
MGSSRAVIVAVVTALSFAVPAGVCLVLAVTPARSVLGVALLAAATLAWLAIVVLVNWWEFTSIHLRWFWSGCGLATGAWRAVHAANLPRTSWARSDAVTVLAIVAGLWILANALRARSASAEAIDLTPPFPPGHYLVTDGGDGARSFLVNYHYGFGRHRSAGVNASMRFATDLVEIGAAGCESRGFIPADNAAYRIWGRPLLAPCGGRVAHVVDDIADNDAFGANRPYGVGNHVVLAAEGGVYVVLGHMQHGSVRVTGGQVVRPGEEIGRVGNSGWTERPHLHVQAMRCRSGDWWHGDPLPIRFGGRFLARNQVLRVGAGERS